MNNLIDTFTEFKELKNINRTTLMTLLEDVFKSTLQKTFGEDNNYDVIVNVDKGDLEIWRNRIVVEDNNFSDPQREIPLKQAKKIDADYEVGEEVTDEVSLESFGRRGILTLKQTLQSCIAELDKDHLYSQYKDRVGKIVTAEVYQVWKKELLLIDENGNELILPRQEQIPGDFFRKGDSIRAVVTRVDMNKYTPLITVSRTSPLFLEQLFEQEVPEVFDGLITVKKIVRVPGERAKIAVESYDDRIDPVGACVGIRGSRIHGIVRELKNENIDVINYTENTKLLIQRALSPANVKSLKIDEETKRVEVFLAPEEVSLAIGKGGLNIKLAGQLTGYSIEVYRDVEEEEDVLLEEFADEIDGWVLDVLKKIGCDTAKNVLSIPKPELLQRSDLEEETVDEVLGILRKELES